MVFSYLLRDEGLIYERQLIEERFVGDRSLALATS
jgi:hypothetical protein